MTLRIVDVGDRPLPELHEFVPYPITAQDKPGHVCGGGCACATCSLQKGDRAVHYQARDRRRPKAPEAWIRDAAPGELQELFGK